MSDTDSLRDSRRLSTMAAEKLRDLSQPIDVALLDATVDAFYGTGSKEEVRSSAPHPILLPPALKCLLFFLLTFFFKIFAATFSCPGTGWQPNEDRCLWVLLGFKALGIASRRLPVCYSC